MCGYNDSKRIRKGLKPLGPLKAKDIKIKDMKQYYKFMSAFLDKIFKLGIKASLEQKKHEKEPKNMKKIKKTTLQIFLAI